MTIDAERLVADLASPIFRWRMANGIVNGFEVQSRNATSDADDPIENDTPQYASAVKRRDQAAADLEEVVRRVASELEFGTDLELDNDQTITVTDQGHVSGYLADPLIDYFNSTDDVITPALVQRHLRCQSRSPESGVQCDLQVEHDGAHTHRNGSQVAVSWAHYEQGAGGCSAHVSDDVYCYRPRGHSGGHRIDPSAHARPIDRFRA